MDTTTFIKYLDIVQKIVTIAAIITGGVWALFKFRLRREHVWNLEMTISSEQLHYSKNLCFLIVTVALKNVGSIKIVPGSKGLELTIKRLPTSIEKNTSVDWWNIEEELFGPKDILAKYKLDGKEDYKGEVYNLDPGCVYYENEGIILEKGYLYQFRLNFWWKENKDNIVQYSYIYCD